MLSSQIFLLSSVKISYCIIFYASVLERLWVKETAISLTSAALFSLLIDTVEVYCFLSYNSPVPE